VGVIASALTALGLPPGRLELEITESVLLENAEANLQTLHQLRELGVRIALDDFGTGYSALSYLQSFPFNKIKIDQTVIKDITVLSGSIAIVKAVVMLALGLGMTTTAEACRSILGLR
jgi:EAL domain-containing protein (putative c-di-GMP-specific phosphodiesterase class I)